GVLFFGTIGAIRTVLTLTRVQTQIMNITILDLPTKKLTSTWSISF
ncbi:hypothetical protein KSS87_008315, partial [Heliosperma pusillum]